MGAPWRQRGPDDIDEEQRERIRRQVLRTVRDYRPSLGDRVYDVFAVLALPAPHLFRAIVALAVVVSIVGTATVASADALPEEPLYGVKIASEQLRLALARTPEDRASVELSMAEHRLAEAVRLVQEGRPSDALVVTSAYGTHLANAAAELATVERLDVASRPVVEQLKQRLTEQQHQAGDMAARLVSDPTTSVGARLFRTIASFAPALPSGVTVSEGIAAHAANVAGQLAAVAERLAEEAAAAEGPPEPAPAAASARTAAVPARATPRPAEPPRATAAQRAAPTTAVGAVAAPEAAKPAARSTVKPAATAEPTRKPRATVDPKKAADTQAAKAAAEKARHGAEKARIAAEKAKEAAKRTASPKPSSKR